MSTRNPADNTPARCRLDELGPDDACCYALVGAYEVPRVSVPRAWTDAAGLGVGDWFFWDTRAGRIWKDPAAVDVDAAEGVLRQARENRT
jgi:hypothetical protein